MAVILLYIFVIYAAHISCNEIESPNIVFIIGDDIGWDDISLHGSDQILTPNIDILGYQGAVLWNYYTDCQGTPSTSAILTGKYPMKIETQGPSIGAGEDRGIPRSERLLPSYLKELGYETHMVGKWQLGKSRECYLPMNRGFDSFYGFTDGSVDYYTYNHMETFNDTDYYGLNLFHNFNPAKDEYGHLTKILTEHAIKVIKNRDTTKPLYLQLSHAAAHVGGGMVHLQASYEDLNANKHIPHTTRRTFASLVTGLDVSLGKIFAALEEQNMLNNTIIVFTSDNGAQSIGPSRNFGSNLPLRGTKGTPWEGAVRSTAIVWHPTIAPKVWKGLFHVTDWLPTLLAAAGDRNIYDIDGVNNWDSIAYGETPKRTDAIIAVNDLQGWGAFRNGDFKIIVGNVPKTCGYYGQELNKVIQGRAPDYEDTLLGSQMSKIFAEKLNSPLDILSVLEKRESCNLNKRNGEYNSTGVQITGMCVPNNIKGCLYNITADPQESQDLWDTFPEITQHMALRFRLLWSELVPRRPPVFDVKADPSLRDYIWYPWLKDDDPLPEPLQIKPRFPLALSNTELQYYVGLNTEAITDKFNQIMRSLANTFTNSVDYIVGL